MYDTYLVCQAQKVDPIPFVMSSFFKQSYLLQYIVRRERGVSDVLPAPALVPYTSAESFGGAMIELPENSVKVAEVVEAAYIADICDIEISLQQ